jgi:uncharacterized membrane protein HdeD (DUF308 family)
MLLICVAFVGFGLGVALAYIAKEELKPFAKFFRAMQGILLLAILIFLFSDLFTRLYYIVSFIFLFGFPTGSLVMLEKFSNKKKKISKKTILINSLIYIMLIAVIVALRLYQAY